MGQEIRLYERGNEFVQDISLDGQRNVAHQTMEVGMGSRGWGRSTNSSRNGRLEGSGRDGRGCWGGGPVYSGCTRGFICPREVNRKCVSSARYQTCVEELRLSISHISTSGVHRKLRFAMDEAIEGTDRRCGIIP
jgi:hypothetical protein